MDRAEVNARLKEAIALAQAGQRIEARRLFSEVVNADPRQELAWMWLATVSTNRDERIDYLEHALALNPQNPTTRRAYEQLTGTPYASPESPRARPQWSARTGEHTAAAGTALVAGPGPGRAHFHDELFHPDGVGRCRRDRDHGRQRRARLIQQNDPAPRPADRASERGTAAVPNAQQYPLPDQHARPLTDVGVERATCDLDGRPD